MANTYTQIYIQVVFAVQGRQCLIQPEHKEDEPEQDAGDGGELLRDGLHDLETPFLCR